MTRPPGGQTDLAASLTQLAALPLSVEDAEQALRRLAAAAVAVIPDGPTCGITVRQRGPYATVVHAGSIAAAVHDAQYAIGQGPCLEALHTRSPVVVQDLAAEARWGDFPRQAVAVGARGTCAFPLEAEDQAIGSEAGMAGVPAGIVAGDGAARTRVNVPTGVPRRAGDSAPGPVPAAR